MDLAGIHVPTVIAIVLILIGVYCLFKFVLKKFV